MSAWRAQKAERSRRRFASLEIYAAKQITALKLQGDIWDSMVQYGDSREKQGFIAGFMMACDLFRTGGTGSYDSKGNA